MFQKYTPETGGCLFALGTFTLIVSLFITLVYWCMDTYGDMSTGSLAPSPRLLNDRIVGVIVGVGWTLASLLILGAAWRALGERSQGN